MSVANGTLKEIRMFKYCFPLSLEDKEAMWFVNNSNLNSLAPLQTVLSEHRTNSIYLEVRPPAQPA